MPRIDNPGFFILCTAVALLFGYLLGSVNFAIIITKLFSHGRDIRDFGSGNAGMTNVLRTVGIFPAVLTLIGDLLKTVVAAAGAGLLFDLAGLDGTVRFAVLVGSAAAFTGHLFPVFYNFRGGKGVLSSAGAFLVIDYRVTLVGLSVFLVVLLVKKIVSVSSITGLASVPVSIVVFALCDGVSLDFFFFAELAVGLYISAVVIIKHRQNIIRLVKGVEPRIGQKLKSEEKTGGIQQ